MRSRKVQFTSILADLALEEGIATLGLRGMAAKIGTSDRMLIYYFGTKDQLIVDVLEQVSTRLSALLLRINDGARSSPGQFLMRVLAMVHDPEIAPFMKLWTEVIARSARGETPYDRIGPGAVKSWTDWIDSKLAPSPGHTETGRAAAILSIVEGAVLLEMAAPGSTKDVACFLSKALNADSSGSDEVIGTGLKR
ncbi:TetR/AcrR family transcriptional regulator [Gluconobacter cerinus]|uniref:TetR family transcriptional regulator n=1 Tax=Gluconobacter cerinus TaxID=38307 RepID=A0AAV5NAC9_9PROT|nr:TetR family transcriptional regulator [Gluconobacter cerinus]GLQ61499.1 TetR family transcriptional regulator [Gluconobacter cerinus]